MDKVTQQNAASSEESSSAATELAGHSRELAEMIASFQLSRGAAHASRPPSADRRARDGANGLSHALAESLPTKGERLSGQI